MTKFQKMRRLPVLKLWEIAKHGDAAERIEALWELHRRLPTMDIDTRENYIHLLCDIAEEDASTLGANAVRILGLIGGDIARRVIRERLEDLNPSLIVLEAFVAIGLCGTEEDARWLLEGEWGVFSVEAMKAAAEILSEFESEKELRERAIKRMLDMRHSSDPMMSEGGYECILRLLDAQDALVITGSENALKNIRDWMGKGILTDGNLVVPIRIHHNNEIAFECMHIANAVAHAGEQVEVHLL